MVDNICTESNKLTCDINIFSNILKLYNLQPLLGIQNIFILNFLIMRDNFNCLQYFLQIIANKIF